MQTASGDVTITRSTISQNDDGVLTETGDITATNSTISGNDGSGVESGTGDIELNWTTVANNFGFNVRVTDGGLIFLYGALIANSDDANDCSESAEDSANSMDTDGSCGLGSGEVSNGTANLGPLQNNGGTTDTHALLTGSDAIDAGGTSCPEDDQRGENRFGGSACDIGSYEGVSTAPTLTPVATSTPCNGPCPTATPTTERAKTHTPTATGTAGPTETPRPSTATPVPATPANDGGAEGGGIRPPDTGSGGSGGAGARGIALGGVMLALAAACVTGVGLRKRA